MWTDNIGAEVDVILDEEGLQLVECDADGETIRIRAGTIIKIHKLCRSPFEFIRVNWRISAIIAVGWIPNYTGDGS